MRILIFDTETGGLEPAIHSVLSVGALVGDLETGEIVSQFECLHKMKSIDDYKYTAKALEINGLTPTQAFNDGLTTEEIRDKFMDLWHDHGAQILGGHNVDYDVEMMACQIYKVTKKQFELNFTYRKVDSLPVMRLFTGNDNVKGGASLSQAVKALNIDMSEFGKNKFHTALYDSICCFKILHKFRKVLSEPDVIERLVK